jgi:hypothetical protein
MSDVTIGQKRLIPSGAQKGLLGIHRRLAGIAAAVVVTCLLAARFFAETAMMGVHGSDPQMAIWWMFLYLQMAFWLAIGGGIAMLMVSYWHRKLGAGMLLITLALWAGAIGWSTWSYACGAKALADAANPSTSPQRLHELVDFPGVQAGYELDNRIADNPSTTPEDLRALSMRDQLGTKMKLAANPNTPADVLEKLFAEKDGYVWNGLARNPNLPESIEKGLEKSSDPHVRY